MEADCSVELGSGAEVLELPWTSPGGEVQYRDLKRQPELLALIPEAVTFPELRDFLASINSDSSLFETAKCDVWSTAEILPEDEIFNLPCKVGCYVDLLYSDLRRFSFPEYESLVKRWTKLLRTAPDVPSSVEFIVRGCYFHSEERNGFYITMYVFGFGEDESRARRQWAIGLQLVANAIKQASIGSGSQSHS